MAAPANIQSLVRPDIRNAVVEVWSQTTEAQMMIADSVAKRIDVDFESGTLIRIPREAYTKDTPNLNRGADGTYQEVEYKTDSLQFATVEQALAVRVDQKMANGAKIYFNAEVVAGKVAMSRLVRGHEIAVAAAVMNTTTFTGAALTAAASANWKTSASSATPIQDILIGRQNVRQNCGREANTIVMDWVCWEALRETSQILGRITGGAHAQDPASVTTDIVSRIIEIPNIIIARGIKDSSDMGQKFTGSAIWDKTKCWLGYVNPAPSKDDISCFHVYNWEGDGGSWDWTMETYFSNEKRANVVRARRQVGIKAEYPECGYLITGAAA